METRNVNIKIYCTKYLLNGLFSFKDNTLHSLVAICILALASE